MKFGIVVVMLMMSAAVMAKTVENTVDLTPAGKGIPKQSCVIVASSISQDEISDEISSDCRLAGIGVSTIDNNYTSIVLRVVSVVNMCEDKSYEYVSHRVLIDVNCYAFYGETILLRFDKDAPIELNAKFKGVDVASNNSQYTSIVLDEEDSARVIKQCMSASKMILRVSWSDIVSTSEFDLKGFSSLYKVYESEDQKLKHIYAQKNKVAVASE